MPMPVPRHASALRLLRGLIGDEGARGALQALRWTQETGKEHLGAWPRPDRVVRGEESTVKIPKWVPGNAEWIYHTHPPGSEESPGVADLTSWLDHAFGRDLVLTPYSVGDKHLVNEPDRFIPQEFPRDFSLVGVGKPRAPVTHGRLRDISRSTEDLFNDDAIMEDIEDQLSRNSGVYLDPSHGRYWLAARRTAEESKAPFYSIVKVPMPWARGAYGADVTPELNQIYKLAKKRGWRRGGRAC